MSRSKDCSYRKVEKVINGKKYYSYEARATVGKDPLTGKQKQISASAPTLKEARDKLKKKVDDYKSIGCVTSSRYTLSSWIEEWLTNYNADKKHSTMTAYKSICEYHIKPAIGNVKLKEFTPLIAQRFLTTITDKKITIGGCVKSDTKTLSAKTIKNIHDTLSVCLQAAVDAKLISFNPMINTVIPKVKSKEINPLSKDDIVKFLDAAKEDEYYDVFVFLVATGCRKEEALALTWDCVDFKNNSVNICKQIEQRTIEEGGYTFTSLKNDKPRELIVPQTVMNILKEIKKNRLQTNSLRISTSVIGKNIDEQMNNLVFTTALGKPIPGNTLYKHCKKIAIKIGRPDFTVHGIRHTYAVLALQNGDDHKTLQANLGHSSAAFTLDRYGHATNDMKIASSQRMEQYISTAI